MVDRFVDVLSVHHHESLNHRAVEINFIPFVVAKVGNQACLPLFLEILLAVRANHGIHLRGNPKRFEELLGAHRLQKHAAEERLGVRLVVGLVGHATELIGLAVANPTD